ncbi:MAG: inositol monophosphatase family protein, partial [Planctomycetota bacterium]|nr:inositol monophosphatase family protein [Planctomycetota bacterium]
MDAHALLEPLARLHDLIGQGVVTACASRETRDLAAVASDEEGDTIYEIDRVSEAELLAGVAELAALAPIVLVAEGIGERVLPDGTAPDAAVWRVIVDPIDGTRGLMYQKRSGWILTAVAPERGPATRLSDVVLAVQTEIPLLKQHLYDRLWAVRGDGAHGERHNRLTGTSEALALRPSTATDLAHGFGQVARFFPGGRDVLAAIDDEIAAVTAGE